MIATVEDGRLTRCGRTRSTRCRPGSPARKGSPSPKWSTTPTVTCHCARRRTDSNRSAGTPPSTTLPPGCPGSCAGTAPGDRLVLLAILPRSATAPDVGDAVHQGHRTAPHLFTSSSQDTSNRLLASQFLYGGPMAVPIPDVMRTDFPGHDRLQSRCVPWKFLTTPRIKGPHARHRQAWWSGGDHRSAPHRNRPQFEWQPITPTATPICCCRCCR